MDIRSTFKLKIYQSNGVEFQNFFTRTMALAYPGFQAVKPHGSLGDRGNDGWIKESGTYYQVYAPEHLPNNTKGAIEKAKADFKTLYDFWSDISTIKKYYFVVNDKFLGVSPHISKTLAEIKSEYALEFTGTLGTSDLENILFSLPSNMIHSALEIPQSHFNPRYDDQKNVKAFLDQLSIVFEELFTLGREAGYFFPSNVYFFIPTWCSNDWEIRRLTSQDPTIALNQLNIKNQLILMHNQISGDDHYENIGLSFKYKPPFNISKRDDLIDERRNTMESFINELSQSYKVISNYAIQGNEESTTL